jgi:hypothetical protein
MTRQYDTANIRSTNCELRSAVYRSYTLPSCDLASPTGRVIGSDFSLVGASYDCGDTGLVRRRVSPLALARGMFQAGSLLRCNDVDEFDAAP